MDQLVELSSRQLEKVGKFELENRPLALPVVLLNLLPQDISQASLGNDVLHLVNGMVANTRHLPRHQQQWLIKMENLTTLLTLIHPLTHRGLC